MSGNGNHLPQVVPTLAGQLEYTAEDSARPVDLDYWSDLASSYEPEWYPIAQSGCSKS